MPRFPTALKAAGIAGALLGIAALGATAGVVAERYTFRRVRRADDDPYSEQPFGELPADETLVVRTHDDVPLHVEVVEPRDGDPELTLVFAHGFCLDMGTWHMQRVALSERDTPRCRLVFYDQPGHGRSGRRESADYTLDQLAEDLHTLIEQVAPRGPLVLLGHSMGGMTLMALAEHYPDLFAERVVGVALLSTSAGHLDDVSLGMPSVVARLRKPLMPTISGALKVRPALMERGRMSGSDLTYLLTRRYGFGSRRPSPALVEYVEHMNAATSVEVIAGYLGTLSEHDRYAALEVFDGVETLIVCGDRDLITPVEHTREMARMLPSAELVEIDGGGHLTLMEHCDVVNDALERFLRRVQHVVADRRTGKRVARDNSARAIAARAERHRKVADSGVRQRSTLRRLLRGRAESTVEKGGDGDPPRAR